MLCVEISEFAIKIIGYDRTAIAGRVARRTRRKGLRGPAGLVRHDNDHTIPAHFHTSDV
jgi:hypothetical protein